MQLQCRQARCQLAHKAVCHGIARCLHAKLEWRPYSNGGCFAVNGTPMCANKGMLQDILRDRLGYRGLVVTDCNALEWMATAPPASRGYAQSLRNASALALAAGTDMTCKAPGVMPLNYTELREDLPADVVERATRHVLQLRIRRARSGTADAPQCLRLSSLACRRPFATIICRGEPSPASCLFVLQVCLTATELATQTLQL